MQYRKVTQVLIKGGHPNVDLAIFPRSVHTAILELCFREGLLSDLSDWTSVDLSVTHQVDQQLSSYSVFGTTVRCPNRTRRL
ncbi:hypothetical protein I79_007012 [Cricetulus griseus]|uniref:Uncharacterized protein n=1 Tax=Cricetulus griseus TaxID=10029 RepID=G3H9E4_CRIGR|nr:hypothetical protein I79_007012 [Cricetulus griseus]